MSKLFLFVAILFVFIHFSLFSKTVKSTIAGGDWKNISTWINKEIPTKDDEVQIDGKVTVMDTFECKDLIINKECTLTVSTPPEKLNCIHGNLTIYGCFETKKSTLTKIYGYIKKDSECMTNEGTITIGN